MVTGASMLRADGYTTRVWLAVEMIQQASKGAAKVNLLSFESIRDLRAREKVSWLQKECMRLGAGCNIVPLLPKKLPWALRLNRRWCAQWIRWHRRKTNANFIHAQSHFAAGAAELATRTDNSIILVFDCHGVDIEEALADGRLARNSASYRFRKKMERMALKRANWFLAVSSNLAEHFSPHLPEESQVRVVSCVSTLNESSNSGFDYLEGNNYSTKNVLYLGSSSPWQQPGFITGIFVELQKLSTDIRLRLVTGNRDFFKALVESVNLSEKVEIVSVSHNEVPAACVGSSIGLLLRQNTIVNQVASPTKFAEYLSMGIPVAISECLSDFAALVEENNIGLVVPNAVGEAEVARCIYSFLNEPTNLGSEMAKRCSDTARNKLSSNSILPTYREIYGGIEFNC